MIELLLKYNLENPEHFPIYLDMEVFKYKSLNQHIFSYVNKYLQVDIFNDFPDTFNKKPISKIEIFDSIRTKYSYVNEYFPVWKNKETIYLSEIDYSGKVTFRYFNEYLYEIHFERLKYTYVP